MYPDEFLQKKLDERLSAGALRRLRLPEGKTDFCSNDYLGIVHNALLRSEGASGATGSRLLSGNYRLLEETENAIAAFHDAAAGLIFNSGYDANIGLLSAVPQKGDTVLYDQLCHASLRDGIRLSFAQSFSFLHNDMDDLARKLEHATGNIFIVTESVFSMDGDICPLEGLVSLAQSRKAHLVVDEAHATGVIGEKGEGLVQAARLQHRVFARIHTFGKACGCHGAAVLGSDALRNYLINFARSLVFSTALPPHAVALIAQSYTTFPGMMNERRHLQKLVARFQSLQLPFEKLPSLTPIQALVIPGNEEVKKASDALQAGGFDVRPILYPTVPKGRERLRIVLHAFNTEAELDQLAELLHASS